MNENQIDSVDCMRRCSDLGIEMGRQKRSKEIMNWARKKRRMIRREDLLAYLAGKPSPPPRTHPHRYLKFSKSYRHFHVSVVLMQLP